MGSAEQKEAATRALDRDGWPVRVYKLGEEPGDDLSGTTTAEQRLAMMWPLALEAWGLTGRPLPDYKREEAPVRVLEATEPEPDRDLT